MKKKERIAPSGEIPILSFFTGGGFLDIGFEQNGFRAVWSNESNPVFAKLYSSGMTAWKRSRNPGDKEAAISSKRKIEQIAAKEIVKTAFPSGKPSLFGAIGGPPCPDFSAGGKHKGGSGSNGKLSKIYVQRIIKIKPTFFIFENVAGLFKTEKHRLFLKKLVNKLENGGYCVDLKLLNALDYGVPQDRERLIMIGVKKNLARACYGRKIQKGEREWFSWPKPKYPNAKETYSWPAKVQEGGRVRIPKSIPSKLMVNSILSAKNDPSKIPNGSDCFKPLSDKFGTIREGDTARKSFKRLHRYRYSPTACYGHNEVHLHPWLPRRLSVREAMRIQGIPDAYELPADAPLSSKYSLVSNGVPVPMAFEVAKSMRKFITLGVYKRTCRR